MKSQEWENEVEKRWRLLLSLVEKSAGFSIAGCDRLSASARVITIHSNSRRFSDGSGGGDSGGIATKAAADMPLIIYVF